MTRDGEIFPKTLGGQGGGERKGGRMGEGRGEGMAVLTLCPANRVREGTQNRKGSRKNP